MAEFPKQFAFPDPQVHVGTNNLNSVGIYGAGTSSASGGWPQSNRAIFVPFRLTSPFSVSTMWWENGATATGNVDIGIYTEDGTRLVSSGSTAQTGTNTTQSVTVTTTQLGPGLFYLALALSSSSGTIFRNTGGGIQNQRVMGLAQQASAFPLPATATLAVMTTAYLPQCGMTGRSFI